MCNDNLWKLKATEELCLSAPCAGPLLSGARGLLDTRADDRCVDTETGVSQAVHRRA